MKSWLPFAAMAGVMIATAVTAYFLIEVGESPKVSPARDTDVGQSPSNADTDNGPPRTSAESTPDERIRALDQLHAKGELRSDTGALRKAIVSDPAEAVQLHALELALDLAQAEGGDATSAVVRTALASTIGNTRARGLRAARENPDPSLVAEMLQLVDSQDPYATMALSALAYTDSETARAKIFEVAQDVSAKRPLRERAIALLAVTKEREARPMLLELANGEDQTLAKIATEVLRVLNEG